MKWIGTQTIYDHVRLIKGITLDSVSITTIQSSGESFADNDTSLMTSAAVDDRIAVTAAALITAEDLDLTADSGTAAVDLNSQALAVTGGTGITTSATGQAVTVNSDAAATHITSLGTLTGLTLDGDKSVTPGDGAMIHVDTSDITDSNTSGSGTAAMYTHVNIEAPRLAATNSSVTTTDAASLYISGAPIASTNQTITNAFALWVDAGLANFDGGIRGALTGNVTGNCSGTAATVTGATQAAITTCANLTTVGRLTGPIEIEQGASGGGSALLIDNDDIDQVALDINAANTTASIAKIVAPDLTSGNAIYVNCDSLTTGKALRLDVDDALTASATKSLLNIDYDKAGDTASGQTSFTTGLDISLQDNADSNHLSGTITMQGINVDIDSTDADGTVNQYGTQVSCIGGDAANTYGYISQVTDGGTDFIAYSSADIADYFSMATTANGATTLTTVDGGSDGANLTLDVDGIIDLQHADGRSVKVTSTETSSSTAGALLNLISDDGAALGDDHMLGRLGFLAAEDTGSTYRLGAKIQAMADAAWSASENGTRLEFYTMDGNNASELSLTLDSDLLATFAGAVTVTGALTGTLATASQPNVTAVGVIADGTWQGDTIASAYIADDAITFAKASGVTPNVYGSIIKLLPSDFAANIDGGNTKFGVGYTDTAGSAYGMKVGSSNTELFAFVSIPEGMKATHVDIYDKDDLAIEVFEVQINATTMTSKGTGNCNTQLDITDVNATATNFLAIKVTTTATTNKVFGGSVTIAAQ